MVVVDWRCFNKDSHTLGVILSSSLYHHHHHYHHPHHHYYHHYNHVPRWEPTRSQIPQVKNTNKINGKSNSYNAQLFFTLYQQFESYLNCSVVNFIYILPGVSVEGLFRSSVSEMVSEAAPDISAQRSSLGILLEPPNEQLACLKTLNTQNPSHT